MNDVTQILSAIEQGDHRAAEQLLPLVYDELRKLAAARLADEKSGQTLQPTALVHEAYLRLVGGGPLANWNGRGHFFAAAAEAMRRILINRARDRQRLKRAAAAAAGSISTPSPSRPPPPTPISSTWTTPSTASPASHPQAAELVKLKFFAGLTLHEAAAALGLPPRSADRLWAFARAWLADALDPG